jgi:fumarylacetoacetase
LPVTLPGGETRTYLQDGDEVIFIARCEAPGAVPIGFGACRGVVTPSMPG